MTPLELNQEYQDWYIKWFYGSRIIIAEMEEGLALLDESKLSEFDENSEPMYVFLEGIKDTVDYWKLLRTQYQDVSAKATSVEVECFIQDAMNNYFLPHDEIILNSLGEYIGKKYVKPLYEKELTND